ncbi:MAG TPA: transketolase [Anaerolineae bacterium]|nr:transketolase [Anaerolineae bacterium]
MTADVAGGATAEEIARLEDMARRIRVAVIRTVAQCKVGHVGGPLSAADILAALYGRILRIRPGEPGWPERDRFILSKGHSALGQYAAMALAGYFDPEEMFTFNQKGSRLQGHPDMNKLPGIDISTGSLGMGLSAGLGMALGARYLGQGFLTWVLLGDGECQEGQVWEAAHVAPRYGLDNLIAIVDHNKFQQFGWRGDSATHRLPPEDPGDLVARFRAFGWRVLEMAGNDMLEVVRVLEEAAQPTGRPTAVIANTLKGYGVSYMAGNYQWHMGVPTEEEFAIAMAELGESDGGDA